MRSARRRSAPSDPASPGPSVGDAPVGTAARSFSELVDEARRGDRAAFDELVRLTHRDTLRLALRLTADPEDARDVVQDAYLRAYKGIRRFRGDAQFTTWLYRITANCAASHTGRGARHRHDELDGDTVIVDGRPESDPEIVAELGALRRDLDAAIAELPDRLRAVVVLRDVYGLPHEAIAAELGISESAAKVRLHRARLRLRERLFTAPDVRVEGARRAV
jgi:RNA polymerase sigma-70 factor (ECF subfamily)